jgi:hypothetical protein
MCPANFGFDRGQSVAEEPRLLSVSEHDGNTIAYVCAFWKRSRRVEIRRDRAERKFRIVRREGRAITAFRDEPARFLMVVPNPGPVNRRRL